MTFRMNPKDTTMRRSVIPASVAFMFNGGLNLVVKPQLFFKNDRFEITSVEDVKGRGMYLEVMAKVVKPSG